MGAGARVQRSEVHGSAIAKAWDKGWTKVYETVPYESFSTSLLAQVSGRLVAAMTVLTPMLDDILQQSSVNRTGNIN